MPEEIFDESVNILEDILDNQTIAIYTLEPVEILQDWYQVRGT